MHQGAFPAPVPHTSAPRGPAHLPTISPAPFGTERPQCFHHVLAGTRQHLQGEPKGGFLLRKPESSPNVTGSLLGENSRDQRNPEACREASTTRCQSSAWRREAAEHLEGRSENARNGAVCRQPGSPGRNTSTGEVQYGRTLIGAPTDLCWEQDRHVPRTPPLAAMKQNLRVVANPRQMLDREENIHLICSISLLGYGAPAYSGSFCILSAVTEHCHK